jgi:hypothetical protein
MALAETYQTRRAGRRIFPSGRATTRSRHLVPDAAGRTALDCELQWMPPEGRHGIQSPEKAAAGRRTQKRCPRHDMPSKMKTRRQTFHATGNAAPQKELGNSLSDSKRNPAVMILGGSESLCPSTTLPAARIECQIACFASLSGIGNAAFGWRGGENAPPWEW